MNTYNNKQNWKQGFILSYVITFFIGAFIGFALFAIVSANGNAEKIKYAYIKGIEDGKRNSRKYNWCIKFQTNDNNNIIHLGCSYMM